MARSWDPVVWAEWRERLSRFESSEMTVAAYCRSEDVSTAAFYQWRKKLHRKSEAKRIPKRSAFVPVVPSLSTVVVTLPNGVRVELPAHDHALVGHVVQAAASVEAAS